MFQFTHPGKGATARTGQTLTKSPSFNSRTLGRVRLSAPHQSAGRMRGFNSRTLGRVRLQQSVNLSTESVFQFTHPGKGATAVDTARLILYAVSIHAPWEGCDVRKIANAKPFTLWVSIHAPWEGCDYCAEKWETSGESFNSRTLGRVRRGQPPSLRRWGYVSIHAPWEGCDFARVYTGVYTTVSIHAPWEGCDMREQNAFTRSMCVSIHAPWEGCDGTGHWGQMEVMVSIHAPWEGCDSRFAHRPSSSPVFQFTHPGKGATIALPVVSAALVKFQFTHPGKGATLLSTYIDSLKDFVSIHAPWEGCDSNCGYSEFEPLPVSIHAPWEGCDQGANAAVNAYMQFQFTHPGKGATSLK